jgi:predicted nucleic acid-binding protein
MFKRQRISLTQAINFLSAYDQIPIRLVEVELDESVKIAHNLGIYAYDAYLIRAAIKYRAPLLTLDRALINHAKEAEVKVIEVI